MKGKSLRWILVAVVVLLLIGHFVLDLLTNYASATVPKIFTQYPYLLWLVIGMVLVLLVGLALLQHFAEKNRLSGSPSRPDFYRPIKGDGMGRFKYDVFISYSHKNSDWVHNVLIPKLKAHGFSVFTDADFTAGAFGSQQMEDGVKRSRRVIAVFTPDYFKSDWATLENVMAQILDPAAKKRKLIPILRETSSVPLRLAGIHWRDLRAEDAGEWERLIEDLM